MLKKSFSLVPKRVEWAISTVSNRYGQTVSINISLAMNRPMSVVHGTRIGTNAMENIERMCHQFQISLDLISCQV